MNPCTHCTGEFARVMCVGCIEVALRNHFNEPIEAARDRAALIFPALYDDEHPPGADLFERA